MTQKNKNTTPMEDDSIDIVALLKDLWVARKIILKITLAFTFLGVFVAVRKMNSPHLPPLCLWHKEPLQEEVAWEVWLL
jgi:hypothetical protein